MAEAWHDWAWALESVVQHAANALQPELALLLELHEQTPAESIARPPAQKVSVRRLMAREKLTHRS
jgi:hypothetical protein